MADIKFSDLWRYHPLNNNEKFPCRLPQDTNLPTGPAKKGAPSFANQCAIRMGVSMHKAGITLDMLPGARSNICWHHEKSQMHILNAHPLANSIGAGRIPGVGPTQKLVGEKAADFYSELFGKKGIIFFLHYWHRSIKRTNPDGSVTWVKSKVATGNHIDVWNGYRTSAAWLMEWFSWLGYYSNYVNSKEIWFWEME